MAAILIVDDSILMRRNLKVLLAEAGHTVVAEAANGIEAYREYAKHLPDLVTMDITMPVLNGVDALKKIIATYPLAKVIMISSLDQKSTVFEAIENGAMHYILKPITLEKILTTIRSVLDLPAVEREKEVGLNTGTGIGLGAEAEAETETEAGSRQFSGMGSTEDGKSAPFTIDNKNGIFIITIFPTLDEAAIQSIHTVLQGFLFIKPLKLVFQIEIEQLTDAELQSFANFVNAIKQVDGTVGIVCRHLRLIRQLKEMDATVFAKIYTELNEIVM